MATKNVSIRKIHPTELYVAPLEIAKGKLADVMKLAINYCHPDNVAYFRQIEHDNSLSLQVSQPELESDYDSDEEGVYLEESSDEEEKD